MNLGLAIGPLGDGEMNLLTGDGASGEVCIWV
jgi:hypothetical protein